MKNVLNATICTIMCLAVAVLYTIRLAGIDNQDGDLGFAMIIIAPLIICMLRSSSNGIGMIARPMAWAAMVFVFIGGGSSLMEYIGIELNGDAAAAWFVGSYWLAFLICECTMNVRTRYMEVE